MPTYLVRIIKNHDLVGIFVARDLREMLITIDECTDPASCEYIKLGAGGIMWTDRAIPVPIDVPDDDDGEESDPVPWGGATFTEVWWNYFHGFSHLRWKRFFEADAPDLPNPPRQEKPAQRASAKVLPFKVRPSKSEPE
ncbi:hypothetical protein [Tardiphaga sp.]|uniref:hypothetical protein n=1 Tax=Tardiphaga sp. TaxID=1926292 RepID=UPI00261493EE|nr:hypothetical protein [Tardiphaga sp.]